MSTQQTTLHDFTLDLLANPDARASFQADPQGALSDAGLEGITAGDVYEILPLVLDSASVVKVDAIDKVLVEAGDITAADHLKLITDNLVSVAPVTDVVATGGIAAFVKDFSDVGDVSSTLDAVVAGNDLATDLVHDNNVVTKIHDVADVDVSEIDVVDDVVAKTAVLNDNDVLTGDIDSTIKAVDVVNVGDTVVQDVAQVGDVHGDLGQVVGDITVGDVAGDVLSGGIGNGNDVDIHF
ncbi:hypothetical protein FKR81_12185 [Lentzea tibetensis]|uniref:Uncharacterized protein n=1 Tax=Lentzea tibetensis TaxID=2591470 RepID=A0A563EX92_9PSEU|nr:IniB N-terminal domain-containing protein [Lentzea tibetensis]TWP52315.1 hypothetical protein FKR81_12185 [Lentzea tibetensis]